jgi:hypothetical protein
MIKKNIILEKNQYDEVCNIIKTFADKRYIISEEKKNSKTIYTIFDRKVESGAFVGMLDMFTSRSLIPKRFRIMIEIYERYNRLNIDLNGDVMMLDWNIVEHNPKRRDQIRLENIIEDLVIKINKIKN